MVVEEVEEAVAVMEVAEEDTVEVAVDMEVVDMVVVAKDMAVAVTATAGVDMEVAEEGMEEEEVVVDMVAVAVEDTTENLQSKKLLTFVLLHGTVKTQAC